MLAAAVPAVLAGSMDCKGTKVCGILTLESGIGSGVYAHKSPCVHGLWPQVKPYGNSACVAPSSSKTAPAQVYSCYEGNSSSAQLDFERHEWGKHGTCAGVKDVDDYFTQICALAADPLKIMDAASPRTLHGMVDALQRIGYEVYETDTQNQQLELSTCLDTTSGQWKLSPVADFAKACGGGSPPAPTPAPAPTAPTPFEPSTQCLPYEQGPACKHDVDCQSFKDCIRCGKKSGFCTSTPLLEQAIM